MSKIADYIRRTFSGNRVSVDKGIQVGGNLFERRWPFADSVFLNCCELLTDLSADVTFTATPSPLFIAFNAFFADEGKTVLTRVFRDGFVVVAHRSVGEGATAAHSFHIATEREYKRIEYTYTTEFESLVAGQDIYLICSSTYKVTGKSDRQVCEPFLEYLDNTLNASNTISARLGALVVASPKNVTNAPAPYVLNKQDKEALEKELGKEYGALQLQRQVMVLPREMSWQVISLSSLDLKTAEKAKMAILAIADRIKVPANQVGLIDAMSSKSLSNGTELREGDFNKYQSFERLLDQTFVKFAKELGIRDINYTIYNKPVRQATTI